MDSGEICVLTLLDYSEAFDRINHKILIAILKYIGFSMSAIRLMIDYLQDRCQYVEISSGRS